MKNPSFLVLTEGKHEVGWIAKHIEEVLKLYEPDLDFKIIKDKKQDIINLETEDGMIVIFIKMAFSQNLRTYNEFVEDRESFEKVYGLDELTAIFSIFDYDPGSTTKDQCIDYFELRDKQENYYPIMTYPGYESQSLIEFHKGLCESYEDIRREKHLHNIEEVLRDLEINDKEISVSKTADVATRVKRIVRQLFRSEILKEDNSIKKYERVLAHIYRQFEEGDYYYYLENQEELFDQVVSEEWIRVSSFLNCIIENILEWIKDEEEE